MKGKSREGFKKGLKNILLNLVWAILILLSVILLYENILLTTVLVGFIATIGLIRWKSYATLAIFVFAAIWGPISEMLAIYFGVWAYAYTNVFNIPSWLFIVWGSAGAFLYQTTLEIINMGVKK